MVVLLLFVALAIVLSYDVLRKPRDRATMSHSFARWIVGGALALLGLFALFMVVLGVGEMAGGDPSGVAHLVPAAAVLVVMLLAWRQPFEVGATLAALGTVAFVYFLFAMNGDLAFRIQGAAIGGAPLLISGLLLIGAAGIAHRTGPHTPHGSRA